MEVPEVRKLALSNDHAMPEVRGLKSVSSLKRLEGVMSLVDAIYRAALEQLAKDRGQTLK